VIHAVSVFKQQGLPKRRYPTTCLHGTNLHCRENLKSHNVNSSLCHKNERKQNEEEKEKKAMNVAEGESER
jgi:hypothetical protein